VAISIDQADGKATRINYACDKEEALDNKYSGSYFLRTSHKDLSSDTIWSINHAEQRGKRFPDT